MSSLADQIKDLINRYKMMSHKGILGMDIGHSGIKLCEVEKIKDEYKLTNFVYSPLPPEAIVDEQIQDRDALVEAIIAAIDESGSPIRKVCFGLYGSKVVTKRLSVPEGSKEEIEDNIVWESEQYIPFDPDDATVKFDILGKNPGGGMDIVMAAGHTFHIEEWQDLVKECSLIPSVVDLNVFALSNVFEVTYRADLEELSKGSIIIDMGAVTTKVIIYKNNGPFLTKELPIGGSIITEDIQRVMGVSFEEAEALKSTVDEEGNLPEEVEAVIASVVDSFIEEIKKTLNFFISAASTENVYYCFITGGSCRIPGFEEALSELVEMEVTLLNAFNDISYDDKFDDDAIAEINYIGATAIGLAMRGDD